MEETEEDRLCSMMCQKELHREGCLIRGLTGGRGGVVGGLQEVDFMGSSCPGSKAWWGGGVGSGHQGSRGL